MHKFKKLTAAMVTAAMMMSIVPFAAFADEADEEVADSPAVVEEVEDEEEAEAEPESEEPEEKAEETETAEEAVEEEEAAPEEVKEEKKDEADPAEETKSVSDDEITFEFDRSYFLKNFDRELTNINKLYDDYAAIKFFGSSGSKYGHGAGTNLTGYERQLYESMRDALTDVADGKTTSSIIEANVDFTPEEYNTVDLNELLDKVFDHVYLDGAYEFYWYDLTMSGGVSGTYSGGMYHITYTLSIPVNKKYRTEGGDQYTLDPSKTRIVSQAVENARRIVNDAAGMSDYKKLLFYKDRICELVEYGSDSFSTDCSPWTLVNVFDMIDSTDAVCEGYAEAFQYLCDLTDFSEDTYVYCVRGDMVGGTGAGRHKWNIVHIGGSNYMADITNSDDQAAGQRGQLFLTGTTIGSYDTSYTYEWPDYQYQDGPSIITEYGSSIVYTYSEDTLSSYTPAQLTLSTTDYVYDPGEAGTTIDDIIHPVGMDLELKDDIAMNLYVETKDGLQAGDKVVITAEGKEPVEQLVSEAATTTKTDYLGKEYNVKIFTIELSAKEMTDDVTFQVKRGSALGEEKHYSIVSYARAILAGGYSETAKDLCRAMLNYGAYAQTYFGYKPGILPNADLTYGNDPIADNQKVTIPSSDYSCSDINSGLTFVGSSLVLKSKTCLRLYFTGDAAIKSEVCDIDSFATEHETLDNGYQVVTISGITADKLNDTFAISISTGNESSIKIEGKPMTYCCKVVSGTYGKSLTELVKSLYLYYQAAVAYQAA
ncbi:MAG: hypothetical protein IKH76_11625 [Clostridiales bacterium]|nr:hypothetical protein [Clostridiales bacterium]